MRSPENRWTILLQKAGSVKGPGFLFFDAQSRFNVLTDHVLSCLCPCACSKTGQYSSKHSTPVNKMQPRI